MPKGRRPAAMPNQTPAWVVDELPAEAVVRPTFGASGNAHDLAKRGFIDLGEGGAEDPGSSRPRCLPPHQICLMESGIALVCDGVGSNGAMAPCHWRSRIRPSTPVHPVERLRDSLAQLDPDSEGVVAVPEFVDGTAFFLRRSGLVLPATAAVSARAHCSRHVPPSSL